MSVAAVRRRPLGVLGALVAAELALVAVHFAAADWSVRSPRYTLYPFVWINAGLLAALTASAPSVPRRRRALAAAGAVAYAVVLARVGGVVGPATEPGFSVAVEWLPPGWGPLVAVTVGAVALTPFPFKVVGYASLGYLAYARLCALDRSLAGGVVGLAACVGCTVPVAASLLAGVGAGALSGVYAHAYDLSTAVFVVAVAALWWPSRGAWLRR